MKTKINIKKLSAFFGLISWVNKSLKVKTPDFEGNSRFTTADEGESFKVQFGSFEYPDPETLPKSYDPQGDGN